MTATELLNLFLQALDRRDYEQIGAVLADEVVLEFPFAPPAIPRLVEGREAAKRFLATTLATFRELTFHDIAVQPLADPAWSLATFRSEGVMAATGKPYRNTYVSFGECRGDRIVLYREHFDPLVGMRAARPD